MDTAILDVLALASAALVFRDARRHAVRVPVLWAAAVLLFWIVALPAYIWCRSAGFGRGWQLWTVRRARSE
jgi:hypothetical protein